MKDLHDTTRTKLPTNIEFCSQLGSIFASTTFSQVHKLLIAQTSIFIILLMTNKKIKIKYMPT